MKVYAIVYRDECYKVKTDLIDAESEERALEYFSTWFKTTPLVFGVVETF